MLGTHVLTTPLRSQKLWLNLATLSHSNAGEDDVIITSEYDSGEDYVVRLQFGELDWKAQASEPQGLSV